MEIGVNCDERVKLSALALERKKYRLANNGKRIHCLSSTILYTDLKKHFFSIYSPKKWSWLEQKCYRAKLSNIID